MGSLHESTTGGVCGHVCYLAMYPFEVTIVPCSGYMHRCADLAWRTLLLDADRVGGSYGHLRGHRRHSHHRSSVRLGNSSFTVDGTAAVAFWTLYDFGDLTHVGVSTFNSVAFEDAVSV